MATARETHVATAHMHGWTITNPVPDTLVFKLNGHMAYVEYSRNGRVHYAYREIDHVRKNTTHPLDNGKAAIITHWLQADTTIKLPTRLYAVQYTVESVAGEQYASTYLLRLAEKSRVAARGGLLAAGITNLGQVLDVTLAEDQDAAPGPITSTAPQPTKPVDLSKPDDHKILASVREVQFAVQHMPPSGNLKVVLFESREEADDYANYLRSTRPESVCTVVSRAVVTGGWEPVA
jgi:hypothetical protein